MSGYKRVDFYELCRLCASSLPNTKTHIFREKGRKIQLQTKIQHLLSLNVTEDDDLPKVVCSKCLEAVESLYSFKNDARASEAMLSSYYNSYRYSADFIKSKKVYIKVMPSLKNSQTAKLPPVHQEPKEDTPKVEPVPPKTMVTVNANGQVLNLTPPSDPKDQQPLIPPQLVNLKPIPEEIKTVNLTEALVIEAPTNRKIYKCPICFKSFNRREHVYQHKKLHTGHRPFKCEFCKKHFMRKEHMMRHMMTHSGEKNFQCEICDKSFSRSDNLTKHKRTHEKEKNDYRCRFCNKQFVLRHYHDAHVLIHQQNGEKTAAVWNVLKT